MAAPSPASSYVNSPAQQYFGGGGAVTFSVKTTLIYIGGSLGVLALVIIVLMVVLVLCVRPTRRRRELYLATQRQRETGVQQVKTEVDTFKPQLRSFPILILQPDSTEIACGQKISLDEGCGFQYNPTYSSGEGDGIGELATLREDSSGSRGSARPQDVAAPAEDPDVSSTAGSRHGSEPVGGGGGAKTPPPDHSSRGHATGEDALPIYNPLTHYMTERQPHLFIAEVQR